MSGENKNILDNSLLQYLADMLSPAGFHPFGVASGLHCGDSKGFCF